MCRGDHWSPANLVQQRVFQESIFTEKRARASNSRPYKVFWQPDRCIVAVADYVDRHRGRGESEEKIRRQLSARAAHGLALRLCRQCSKLCKKTALPSNAARQFFVRIPDQGYIFSRRTQNTKYAPARCRPECSRGERAPRAASYKSRTPSKV